MKVIYNILCYILWILEKIFYGIEWIFGYLSWRCLCGHNYFINKLNHKYASKWECWLVYWKWKLFGRWIS